MNAVPGKDYIFTKHFPLEEQHCTGRQLSRRQGKQATHKTDHTKAPPEIMTTVTRTAHFYGSRAHEEAIGISQSKYKRLVANACLLPA